MHTDARPLLSVYQPEEIVYLSPDASSVLTSLDDKTVYVVGGIVDRAVLKGQSLSKASRHAVRVQRLPLQEYMNVNNPVLNIDAVLIALNEFANHRDWSRAFDAAIPKRRATRK
jgi:tRNA (guanine9-N1)-methyltransferase